jgi:hypothetical protein
MPTVVGTFARLQKRAAGERGMPPPNSLAFCALRHRRDSPLSGTVLDVIARDCGKQAPGAIARATYKGACQMTVKITPNDKGNPPGKLADAELHFTEGPLAGLKLIGFTIWERRDGAGRNVTFPARSYSINGERRSFALLRPIVDTTTQTKLRDIILDAFQEYEERAAVAS